MRLRERRGWGLLFILMVKLVSGGCGVAGAELLGIGGGKWSTPQCRYRWNVYRSRADARRRNEFLLQGQFDTGKPGGRRHHRIAVDPRPIGARGLRHRRGAAWNDSRVQHASAEAGRAMRPHNHEGI